MAGLWTDEDCRCRELYIDAENMDDEDCQSVVKERNG